MVLKVVAGKILEALKLSRCPSACGSVLELPSRTGEEATIRLPKILDYLIDNLHMPMLSLIRKWDQAEKWPDSGSAYGFRN